MTARPRLLFVSARYLLPADSGGKIRTGHVLRGLKDGRFEVTLVSPAPAGAAARDAVALAQMCDRFASWPEAGRGKLFAYLRARHFVSALPISVATDVSVPGRALIAAELARAPDLVIVDFAHAAVLVPEPCEAATILFTHNVEAEIFARHLRVASNPLLRAVWQNQLDKMVRFERDALRRFDGAIAVSDRDRERFLTEYGVASSVIPTGVDLDFFAFEPPSLVTPPEPTIVFTASMDSFANIDGIRWFMDEIWPLVAAAQPQARVEIVGRNPDQKLVRAAAQRRLRWNFTGFVDDIRPYMRDAAVYIIPLRVGGGTRIKAYEAMATGRPVVSTAIGIEGLDLVPDRHFLLADSPQDFAASVLRLIEDGALRQRLATAARDLVERHFSARSVAVVFETICFEVLERRTGRARQPQDAPSLT